MSRVIALETVKWLLPRILQFCYVEPQKEALEEFLHALKARIPRAQVMVCSQTGLASSQGALFSPPYYKWLKGETIWKKIEWGKKVGNEGVRISNEQSHSLYPHAPIHFISHKLSIQLIIEMGSAMPHWVMHSKTIL